MKKNSKLLKTISLVLVALLLLSGCGKENKYVNIGIEESTAGLSLYLTNTAKGLEKISNYVFFSTDMNETFEKLSKDKQGIDISYVPVTELGRIKENSNFRVVYVDCFEKNGDLKGVWVARDGWFVDAPTYSKKYIRGLVKSTDYRASHMNMTYKEALESIKGMRDFDFDVQDETLQFVAVFDQSNDDVITDCEFIAKSSSELREMFAGFADGTGEGFRLCRQAYDKYCTASDVMSFEKMFNFECMLSAIDEVLNDENR